MLTTPIRQRERRLSPPRYRLLVAAHVIVSGTWLGVAVAKLVLGLAAMRASEPAVGATLYAATAVVNPAFPPLAIGTIVTGVLLGLGTKWGVLQYYWVVVKLGLTVGVIATAVQLGDRFLGQSLATLSGPGVASGTMLGMAWGPVLLISLSVAHTLMLGIATVLSIYKPWGKTWFGRHQLARPVLGRQVAKDA